MATVIERQTQIEYIWRDSFQTELNDALKEELRQAALEGVKACLEEALRQELTEHLGFDPYERQAEGAKRPEAQRSGYFERGVDTDHGHIPDLKVPKLRRGNQDRAWQVLTRYQRCLQYVLDALLYIYLLGLSLPDLQEALYVLYGSLLSVSAINQVTTHVQATVTARQNRPLDATAPFILVDGVWVKILYPTGEVWVDQAGHTRQKRRAEERVILAALAVWPDGRYHLLHYEIAVTEDEAAWKAFWQHLIERGLDPQAVQLVVSDGTKGLLPAMKQYLPKAKLQRCTVHKIRGFERHLSYQDLPDVDPETGQPLTEDQAKAQRRAQMRAEAHEIFKAPTRPEAQQRLAEFVAQWESLEPQAVKNFTWGLKRCFEFYAFDEALHPLIRSTNLLERFFREFRAKADEIGCFPNETSGLTIFHLVMVRDHAKHNRFAFAKN
jgi:transposase-like protein